MVCLDESPLQLIGEVREPIPAAPGQLERVDYEYRRNGTVNLFVAVDAHRPWRKVTVTEQRTARDYAKRLRELVDVDYPDAGCIRVVQDNLSTHTPGSLYEAFPAPEAHRILERLERPVKSLRDWPNRFSDLRERGVQRRQKINSELRGTL